MSPFRHKIIQDICHTQHGIAGGIQNNDIAYRRFHYWYRRYRIGEQGHARDQENDRFVPLVVGPSAAAGSWCELSFPEGKRLAFHQPVSAEFLRSLIG